MAQSFEFEAKGVDELQQKLKAAKGHMNVKAWLDKSSLRVISYARRQRFRHVAGGGGSAGNVPPVPGILTSRHPGMGLEGSIHYQIQQDGMDKVSHIGVPESIPYGRIHEYGGRTGRGHAARMPKRPYLVPSLKAQEHNIQKDFADGVDAALRKARLK